MTLRLEGITRQIEGQTHFHPLDLECVPGGSNTLLGHMLAGKTTLMRLMAGLAPVQAACERLGDLRPRAVRRHARDRASAGCARLADGHVDRVDRDPRHLHVYNTSGRRAAHPCARTRGTARHDSLRRLDRVWKNGKTYLLLGPSGCDKTTLLNIISGLITPSEGHVLFDNRA